MDRGDGGDAEGVALTASYGHTLVERGALGGHQVGEQLAELRALRRVETAGGADLLLEDDRALDPGLVQNEILTTRCTWCVLVPARTAHVAYVLRSRDCLVSPEAATVRTAYFSSSESPDMGLVNIYRAHRATRPDLMEAI
ncbi:hypothetical protein GCM10009574_071640 [Streptomyces asiaticus]|uniref:Uncharacterized protein n=2 Tax=Streptomyces rhizosphaericus TaxID=114699 RepID=A0ABP4D0G2_9ACTN